MIFDLSFDVSLFNFCNLLYSYHMWVLFLTVLLVFSTVTESLPSLSISASTSNLSEVAQSSAVVIVSKSLNGGPDQSLTVDIHLYGTAIINTDYSCTPPLIQGASISNYFTIASGTSNASFTITAIDRQSSGGSESIILSLTPLSTYSVPASSSFVSLELILDFPVTVSVLVSPPSISNNYPYPIYFTFVQTGALSSPLTVYFGVSGTAVIGTDVFLSTLITENGTGSVLLPSGSDSSTIVCSLLPSLAVEGNKTLTLTILSSFPAFSPSSFFSSASLTIVDSSFPSISLVPSALIISENSSAPLEVSVTRVGSLSSPLTILLSISGSAQLGSDYFFSLSSLQMGQNSLSFALNSAVISFTVQPINNNITEAQKTIVMELQLSYNPTYIIAPPVGATVIISEDDLYTVSLSSTVSVLYQSETGIYLTISRSGGNLLNNLLVYLQLGGTAVLNSDFFLPQTSVDSSVFYVWIPTLQTSSSVFLSPSSGNLQNSTTVVVSLLSSTLYIIGLPHQISIELLSGANPNPPLSPSASPFPSQSNVGSSSSSITQVSISPMSASVLIPGVNNSLAILFTRTQASSSQIVVGLNISGSATAGIDFSINSTNSVVVFPKNVFAVSFLLTIPSSLVLTSNKNVVLALLPSAFGLYTINPNNSLSTVTLINSFAVMSQFGVSQNTTGILPAQTISFSFRRIGGEDSALTVTVIEFMLTTRMIKGQDFSCSVILIPTLDGSGYTGTVNVRLLTTVTLSLSPFFTSGVIYSNLLQILPQPGVYWANAISAAVRFSSGGLAILSLSLSQSSISKGQNSTLTLLRSASFPFSTAVTVLFNDTTNIAVSSVLSSGALLSVPFVKDRQFGVQFVPFQTTMTFLVQSIQNDLLLPPSKTVLISLLNSLDFAFESPSSLQSQLSLNIINNNFASIGVADQRIGKSYGFDFIFYVASNDSVTLLPINFIMTGTGELNQDFSLLPGEGVVSVEQTFPSVLEKRQNANYGTLYADLSFSHFFNKEFSLRVLPLREINLSEGLTTRMILAYGDGYKVDIDYPLTDYVTLSTFAGPPKNESSFRSSEFDIHKSNALSPFCGYVLVSAVAVLCSLIIVF